MRLRLILVATVAGMLVTSLGFAQQQPGMRKRPLKVAPPAVEPAPVLPPAPPPTLEQMPSSPPQIAYTDGQLSIMAQNATLGDILRGVHRQTGAVVDVPSNATERVVGQFGPGPARDVLASLLNGSHFNYVLLGSATNPTALDRVVLISKANEQAAAPGGGASAMPAPVPAVTAAGVPGGDGIDMSAATDDAPDGADIDLSSDDTPTAAAEEQAQPQNGAAIKTPEQMLQELQQRQQQIQQQQQQPGNPQGFPRGGIPPGPGVPQQQQPQQQQ